LKLCLWTNVRERIQGHGIEDEEEDEDEDELDASGDGS
jgi:hypothetical protein